MKKFAAAALTIALLLSATLSLRAADYGVLVSRPPNCVNFVRPEFPVSFARRGAEGRGVFLLKLNPRTGDVDQVQVVRHMRFKALEELAVRAFFQWKFQPGTPGPVKVPCEFFVTGFSRSLH